MKNIDEIEKLREKLYKSLDCDNKKEVINISKKLNKEILKHIKKTVKIKK